jgi:hypothetical protein
MTRDDIIRMAREAGMEIWRNGHRYMDEFDIYEFAALVAAAEREECAKLCEDKNTLLAWPTYAAAIRARGQA